MMDEQKEKQRPAAAPVLSARQPTCEEKLYKGIDAADFAKAKRFKLALFSAFPVVIILGIVVMWIAGVVFPDSSRLLAYLMMGYVAVMVGPMTYLWSKGSGLLKTRPYIDYDRDQKLESFRSKNGRGGA